MATAVIIIVVIVAIALIAATAIAARRRRLQQRFGPEYDRAVSDQDSRLRAEAELTERQRRVRRLDIQPLSEAARSRYLAQWQTVQEQFVESPQTAVADAYALVTTVMRERGYPVTDEEQVMADLSVEHASTVGHFRSAQEIARNAASGGAATEDLRQALIHYRALFADLLGDPALTGSGAPAAEPDATESLATESYAAEPAGTEPEADAYLDAGSSPHQQGR
jgi:FtsZ-interacting cell division protein ZipA